MNDPRTKQEAMIDEAVVGLRNVTMTIRDIVTAIGPNKLYGDLAAMKEDLAVLKEALDAVEACKNLDREVAINRAAIITVWSANYVH